MAYSRQVYRREVEAAEKASIPTPTYETHIFNHKRHTTTIRNAYEDESIEATTKRSFIAKLDHGFNKGIDVVAETTKLPQWGLVVIYIGILLLSLGLLYLAVRMLRQKRRGKNNKNVADLKSVQYKVKVEPDMEELTTNDDKLNSYNWGKLKYKLDYDFSSNSLHVTVIQADELPALDVGRLANPYVKIYLLPDKKKIFETEVRLKTTNAVFNETFVFKNLPYAKAMNATLVFVIFDFGTFTKREIGEVRVPLCQSDLTQTIVESNIQKIRSSTVPKN